MRKYYYLLFAVLSALCILSCSEEEEDNGLVPPYPGPLLTHVYDGGVINEISIEGHSTSYDGVYINENHVIHYKSYSALYIAVDVGGYNLKEIEDNKYAKERTSFILEPYMQYLDGAEWYKKEKSWPDPFTAFINGQVKITCDKVLFGEAPGTVLNKHFKVNGKSCMAVGIEHPYLLYGYNDQMPTAVDDYFVKDSWLTTRYSLRFNDIPSEKYDEMKIFVTMPILKEHTNEYLKAKANGEDATLRYTEEVFTASCNLKFKWE